MNKSNIANWGRGLFIHQETKTPKTNINLKIAKIWEQKKKEQQKSTQMQDYVGKLLTLVASSVSDLLQLIESSFHQG